MSLMNFVKKHLTLTVVVGVLAVCSIVAATAFIVSGSKYAAYEKQYEKDAEEIKASLPLLPEEVFIDNDYVTYGDDAVTASKSSFKSSYIYHAREAVVAPLSQDKAQEYKKIDGDSSALGEYITSLDRRGGAITFTINTESYGMSDIDIVLRTNWVDDKGVYHALENITDYIKIQVNKLELKTEELELPANRDTFQHLILKNTHLVKGENTIALTTSAYNTFANKDDILYVMPDIRNLTVITDVEVVKA